MLTEGLVTEVVNIARAISGLLGYLGSGRTRETVGLGTV